jgi:hypothetical protein
MRNSTGAALLMLCAIAGGCEPKDKCGAGRYYESATALCFDCPMDATFKNDRCECNDDKYEFKNRSCVLKDGETAEPPDSGMMQEEDAGASATAAVRCDDYCGFAMVCIGNNTLAQSALPAIITGLHADDEAACTASCESTLGNDGSNDPVIACIEAGRDTLMCSGGGSTDSLTDAMMLVSDCCTPRRSNALCKSICVPLKANPLTASSVMFCD